MTALLLAALHVAAFRFERGADGSWRLLRDGKAVRELPLRDAVVVDTAPGDWRTPARTVRRMAASETQKQLYIAFLKRTHGYQIAAVNQAYGLDASAFTDLESWDFATLDESRAGVVKDDIAFVVEWFGEQLRERGAAKGAIRVAGAAKGAPEGFVRALGELPEVDGILLRDPDPEPVQGVAKPLLLLGCPAVRPAFITACARI